MLTPVEWVVFGIIGLTALLGLMFVQRLQTDTGEGGATFDWHPELELKPKSQKAGNSESLDRWLHRAVSQSGIGMDLSTFLVLASCLGIVAGVAVWQFGGSIVEQVLTGITAFLFAVLAMLLMYRSERKKFDEQFPIAIELMSSAVGAGETFEKALQVACDSSQNPVKGELQRCLSKIRMGMADNESVDLLAHRVPTMDVKIFAHTIAVHCEMGGPLARTLQRLASVIHERREYRQKMWSATSLGRFAAVMISAIGILALAYLFWFEPDYIGKLLQSRLGIQMTIYAIISEIVGIVWVAIAMGPEV